MNYSNNFSTYDSRFHSVITQFYLAQNLFSTLLQYQLLNHKEKKKINLHTSPALQYYLIHSKY